MGSFSVTREEYCVRFLLLGNHWLSLETLQKTTTIVWRQDRIKIRERKSMGPCERANMDAVTMVTLYIKLVSLSLDYLDFISVSFILKVIHFSAHAVPVIAQQLQPYCILMFRTLCSPPRRGHTSPRANFGLRCKIREWEHLDGLSAALNTSMATCHITAEGANRP